MKGYSLVGAVLSIIAGTLGLMGAAMWAFILVISWTTITDPGFESSLTKSDFQQAAVVLLSIAIITFIIGLLAIIGGIFGCRREKWGLALAGAIASTLAFFPCGLAAIVFVALGKAEFGGSLETDSTANP